MNKKLLFAALSLAAFTACTDDNFESQKQLAEQTCPVEFELVNDATRASMNGNQIVWTSDDHDLFTLYHGSAAEGFTSGYENATYEAHSDGTTAKLTTPTMIKQGRAIMVWPCDTTFRIKPADNLTLVIPAAQTNIENNMPWVSDLLNIGEYAEYSEADPGRTDYNTAGYARKYPVFMRPMASQLNLKPNYDGMTTLQGMTTGEDAIAPITIDKIQILTAPDGADKFTTEIPLVFNAPAEGQGANWALVANHRAWDKVTTFDKANIAADGKTATLSSTCFNAETGICKFLFLPQGNIEGGVDNAAIIVDTYYGQVVVARGEDVYGFVGRYTEDELEAAWYRFRSDKPEVETNNEHTAAAKETAPDGTQKYRCTAAPAYGLQQTLNIFSNFTAPATSTVAAEPEGTAYTRYLNVLLKYLDMTNLHIKSDKQLRDAARVWKELNLASVTVYLDGDGTNHGFVMSQQTIAKINEINAAVGPNRKFTVKPCDVEGEVCNEIIITGGGVIPNLDFILANVAEEEVEPDEPIIGPDGPNPLPAAAKKANVVLQTGSTWTWDGTIKVAPAEETGISSIINRGTMQNAQTKTLLIEDIAAEPQAVDIPVIIDRPGKWNITAGTINVQNRVTNNGTVTISSGAQYRQDGGKLGENSIFINEADTKEARFLGDDEVQHIGKVVNYGVFAAVGDAIINNYSLIEHAADDAKTYITHNQTIGANAANFAEGFNPETNKMGRINLQYTNKDEDNISISAVDDPAHMEGFVSVTVAGDNANKVTLSNTSVGQFVNYIIINSGISEITNLSDQIKYVEINQPGTEIEWNLDPTTPKIAQYEGLIVLSDVNIKLGTTITATVTYLHKNAEMYVGGVFNKLALNAPLDPVTADATDWDGYYGATSGNVATNYVTFK